MKKLLFGIFAHPDDEGFGPSGSLIMETDNGTDLHLICVTTGDAGQNVDDHHSLGQLRKREWQSAAELIGARTTTWLGHEDGSLSNQLYHDIANKVSNTIETTVASYDQPVSVQFMTFDTTGLSGHLDHIAVSMITSYVYIDLVNSKPHWQFDGLDYFCLPYDAKRAHDVSYVYTPPGRQQQEIDKSIDVSSVYQRKLEVMRAHHSQRDDMNWIIDRHGEKLKTEHFRFLKIS